LCEESVTRLNWKVAAMYGTQIKYTTVFLFWSADLKLKFQYCVSKMSESVLILFTSETLS